MIQRAWVPCGGCSGCWCTIRTGEAPGVIRIRATHDAVCLVPSRPRRQREINRLLADLLVRGKRRGQVTVTGVHVRVAA